MSELFPGSSTPRLERIALLTFGISIVVYGRKPADSRPVAVEHDFPSSESDSDSKQKSASHT